MSTTSQHQSQPPSFMELQRKAGSHSEFGRIDEIGNEQHQKWTFIPQYLLGPALSLWQDTYLKMAKLNHLITS